MLLFRLFGKIGFPVGQGQAAETWYLLAFVLLDIDIPVIYDLATPVGTGTAPH